MSIITFWSDTKKPTSQTTSVITSALQMGIERNLKILIIDASFNDNTMSKALEQEDVAAFNKTLNIGKVDISGGMEGVLSAVASNKLSPETIKSYSTPILVGRVDILFGVKTKEKSTFDEVLPSIFETARIANQYYDLVFIDLQKGERTETIKEILAKSDLIVYTLEQKLEQIEKFVSLWGIDENLKDKFTVIPLLTKEDSFSKYNCDNVARKIGMRPGMPSIVYNTLLMEAIQEGKLVRLLIMLNDNDATYRNNYLIRTIEDFNTLLIERIQQLHYRR